MFIDSTIYNNNPIALCLGEKLLIKTHCLKEYNIAIYTLTKPCDIQLWTILFEMDINIYIYGAKISYVICILYWWYPEV